MEYLLIFLVNLLYLPCFRFGLVSDDGAVMATRPYNLRTMRPFVFVLHLMVCEFIYIAFGCSQAAFLAALCFSVHPMCVQVPAWMSGKTYGLCALLFLMVWTFPPFSSALFFLAGVMLTPFAVTPILFFFTKYWYLGFFLILTLFLNYKVIMNNIKWKTEGDGWLTSALPKDMGMMEFTPRKLILAVKTFWYYTLACLFPPKCGFYNSYLTTFGSSRQSTEYWYSINKHFWFGIIALVVLFSLWVTNMTNLVGIGILLYCASIFPFLNILTCQQWTAPRYAYVPLLGFQIALWTLATRYCAEGVVLGVFGGIFSGYVIKTKQVLEHYKKDNIWLHTLDRQVFPDNPRLWYFMYEHMLHKKNDIMAWAECAYGLMYLPNDCQLWFGLACASFNLGNPKSASQFLDKAEQYMIQADRKNMAEYIQDLRTQIRKKMGLI